MKTSNHIAFKEWAVVCQALRAGAQTLFIRKGGISEGRDGFRINHDEFWLYPTQFHQGDEAIVPSAKPYWEATRDNAPPANQVPISLYCTVSDVHELADLDCLHRLAGLHILSEKTVEQRFHYRQPGVFVIVARVYRLAEPFDVTETATMAGCKSWVELPDAFSTAGLIPVLSDEDFAELRDAVRRILFET
ncbi:MAG: DUF1802 family protein [Planctomycetaceae bacterium]